MGRKMEILVSGCSASPALRSYEMTAVGIDGYCFSASCYLVSLSRTGAAEFMLFGITVGMHAERLSVPLPAE